MAFHPYHLSDLARVRPYIAPRMLMLGAQRCLLSGYAASRAYFAQWVGHEYAELDLDGGDLRLDLNRDLAELQHSYRTVFNMGTIEHVWNAHAAWANALRAVEIGGHLISQSPSAGWYGHGIHLTHPEAIKAFLCKNGFEIIEEWRVVRVGAGQWSVTTRTSKRETRSESLWLVARKAIHIPLLEDYQPAWQVYKDNEKLPIC